MNTTGWAVCTSQLEPIIDSVRATRRDAIVGYLERRGMEIMPYVEDRMVESLFRTIGSPFGIKLKKVQVNVK